MKQTQVRELLEALKGKTVIDTIAITYKNSCIKPLPAAAYDANYVNVNQTENALNLKFKSEFLTYVAWPYFSILKSINKTKGIPVTIDVQAHQLFENQKKSFGLKFRKEGLIFENRKNIEDTLFLDLQRYCEHNKIKYEVKQYAR